MSAPSSRRYIRWSALKSSPRRWLALVGATFFGSGLLPKAPGTWGTLAAMPLWYFVHDREPSQRWAIWMLLAVWGVWSAKEFDEMNDTQDNQNIVMDEVTGVGLTAWTAGPHLINYFAAFVLFRAFDIVKPYPVRAVDRWSHRPGNRWLAGFGVMADDWVAGLQALLLIVLAQAWGWLPR